MLGYFVWKITILRQKNNIFPILGGGGARNFWGISCEKSRFYAKKIIFFPILGGARAGCAPHWIRPWDNMLNYTSCPIVLSSIKTIGPTTSEELHLQSEAGRTNKWTNQQRNRKSICSMLSYAGHIKRTQIRLKI